MTPYLKYDLVPDMTFYDSEDEERNLRDFQGRNMVLLVYESNYEAETRRVLKAIHNRLDSFRDEHANIVCVSLETPKEHRDFLDQEVLPFTFLSDPGRNLAKLLGAHDRVRGRVHNTTYIVDREGRIEARIPDMTDHIGHTRRALDLLAEMDRIEHWSVPT
ncbi:MAG: peroxiredoxin family protein [Euryarchaeota archaeon]|nr:peroxiredoxin family protein [Euryarchaeota archaeon]